ncbi:YraN family protein [Patescibacteria group bacterium]|nr:YraN family protein [Patescibacteria group bacterium]
MTNRQTIGRIGEELACKFIKSKRYKIIERNHRQKWGEIDIISVAPDKTLVFFEVKTLSGNPAIAGLTPEDNLSRAKLQKLQRIGKRFKFVSGQRLWFAHEASSVSSFICSPAISVFLSIRSLSHRCSK